MDNQKIYFITYGDSNFFLQRKHLINLARKSGLFDDCIEFTKKDISKTFINKYKEILDSNRGGGYWLWKYFVISKTLEEISDGDIVVYSDAGSSFNKHGSDKFKEYIKLLNMSKTGNLRFKMEYIENEWTTKEIFEYFNIDLNSDFGNSGQLHATHMLFKKNKNTEKIFLEFKKLLEFNPYLITDRYNDNQSKGFVDNRHDQSIFSILSKKYGYVEISCDETCSSVILNNQELYPFISTRRRYTFWEKIRFILLYFYHINQTVFFNQKDFWYQKPSLYERILYKFSKSK